MKAVFEISWRYLLLFCLFGPQWVLANVESAKGERDQIQTFSTEEALAVSQSALGNIVGNYPLTDSLGQPVSLHQFRDKPLVISMIYTSCYHICPMTTQNLHKVVMKARDVLGADSFNVLTIGFDSARDTPEAMGHFAKAQYAGADNWFFLAAGPGVIQALSHELGFIFVKSAVGFDHLIQATILDRHGKVVRQVYGNLPQTPHFVEPLKALIFGEKLEDNFFSKLAKQVKLFCTVYDPKQDRYFYDFSIFVGVFVGLLMGSVFLIILRREWRYSRTAQNRSDRK